MDVIALAAAGIAECVAPLGTALTEQQIEMLWRHVETPILCFDGDAAGQRAAMRAAARALPLLRPAHSLRIVRLPEGLDPDDLLKAKGRAAMEGLLGDARSLVDVLWEAERDALPLNTPEAKAGLKARLLAHIEAIAHPDVASLYKRDLLDRYGALVFPRREERPRAPGRQPNRVPRGQKGYFPEHQPSDPQSIARLNRAMDGNRDALSAAVLAGLVRWPTEIARHAEALGATAGLDRRFAILVDCCDSAHPLESDALGTILAQHGLELPGPAAWSDLRFGFLQPDVEAGQASAELAQAIDLLVERPALEAALARATGRFESDRKKRFWSSNVCSRESWNLTIA
jgi:DNA primase